MRCLAVAILLAISSWTAEAYAPKVFLRIQSRIMMAEDLHLVDKPFKSLASGSWVKFICGASNQDIPVIRNLCTIYTLVGVDCIDISADPSVVTAAQEGINAAFSLHSSVRLSKPLLMISVNDFEDPHFRKAYFDPKHCPADCARPCETVCPAFAIPPLTKLKQDNNNGVVSERCYGCGRCVPICPFGLVKTESYIVDSTRIVDLFRSEAVDAIEIHTQPGNQKLFADLWTDIGHEVLTYAKVIAVSFPDMGDHTLPYLEDLQKIMSTHPTWEAFRGVQIWQADGRPMSGDIGKGTAHKSSNLATFVLSQIETRDRNHGNTDKPASASVLARSINIHNSRHYIQLAGGTNDYSAKTASDEGLIGRTGFGGFAFGGYARKTLTKILIELEDSYTGAKIEDHPEVLKKCVEFASRLVSTVKG